MKEREVLQDNAEHRAKLTQALARLMMAWREQWLSCIGRGAFRMAFLYHQPNELPRLDELDSFLSLVCSHPDLRRFQNNVRTVAVDALCDAIADRDEKDSVLIVENARDITQQLQAYIARNMNGIRERMLFVIPISCPAEELMCMDERPDEEKPWTLMFREAGTNMRWPSADEQRRPLVQLIWTESGGFRLPTKRSGRATSAESATS